MSRTKHKLLCRLHDSGSAVRWSSLFTILTLLFPHLLLTHASESDKSERFLDKINEQSIAAVFNKVAYGSTTKRSIPDNAFIYTTLATPLLTTYRYSDGNQEWYRVDVKEPENPETEKPKEEIPEDVILQKEQDSYGSDLEKDHVLPTSAPAADILKNNNNKNYNNPNRYSNDRLRPDLPQPSTPSPISTSTAFALRGNVRPTKALGATGREPPSYVPPSRAFFTPPLPPEYLNPFADKPTLRGTNSEGYQSRRPIPPPSLMPKKDRIPFRPDLPPNVNDPPPLPASHNSSPPLTQDSSQRKKTLNTPSQNVHLDRLSEFYGLNRLHNETNFEYEPMVLIPSISRILSGSNGRKEDIPDILLRQVTASPPQSPNPAPNQPPVPSTTTPPPQIIEQVALATVPKNEQKPIRTEPETTTSGDILNLPNIKIKKTEVQNATKAKTDTEIWHISWNVHVYLVVLLYVILAIFSIVKLIKYDRDSHMFSKTYFLSVHLLLTTICTMRIFYLVYDPYNISQSYGNFGFELLHNLPLSLLATTFAILIVFLLKRTLNHLKVKTRPIFLVFFGLGHIFLCFCLNLAENFELFGRGSFLSLICRFVYILLCWSLGLSYVYLYRIIKNVLAKKSQNLSEICTQNISYASHITIAIALLFTLLGFVCLYGLFFIKIDKFTVPHHWILWGFELSVRLLEITIISLLSIVVSLRLSQREKQNVGFPLFPCTTSDSSTDNIYPNNCSTNLNALNYSLRSQNQAFRSQNSQIQEIENIPNDIIERPNFEKKSTLERPQNHEQDTPRSSVQNFERFERPNWALERENYGGRNFDETNQFERSSGRFPNSFEGPNLTRDGSSLGSGRLKPYEKCRYYAKPKYDDMYNSSRDGDDEPKYKRNHERELDNSSNVYSEPLEPPSSSSDYERGGDPRPTSRQSWTNSGRRSAGGRRSRRPHHAAGVHTLPPGGSEAVPGGPTAPAGAGSMLVDENGFVRFRALADERRRFRYPEEFSDA